MNANYSHYPRPATLQELLRRFAAGNPAGRDESVRYLAAPVYKVMGTGKVWTVAGDGHVFLWVGSQVPGFRDYEIPPPGGVHVDLPEVMGRWGGNLQDEVPGLSGPADDGVQEVPLMGGGRALVRRCDLVRLLALDWCRVGPGMGAAAWGGRPFWQYGALKWLAFAGNFGDRAVRGVVRCMEPAALVRPRSAGPKKAGARVSKGRKSRSKKQPGGAQKAA